MLSEIPSTLWDPLYEAGKIVVSGRVREFARDDDGNDDDVEQMKAVINKMQKVINS